MTALGISCWYHDSAAAIVRDGNIIAAAQEERFTRKKHDPGFPSRAIQYCMDAAGVGPSEVDVVAFYDKPFLKFERLLESYVSYAPRGLRSFTKSMPLWLKQKLWIPDLLRKELEFSGDIVFPEHHVSHAASAFYPSPFDSAAFLTTDGVGEWTTTSYGVGSPETLSITKEIHFPHSLGLLYSAFTYFCGFKVNSGEYKLMGLAPYGEPKYESIIRDTLIDLRDDGSFRLNMDYFSYASGLRMTGSKFARLFGGQRRQPESELTQREMDLARSIQKVVEEAVVKMAAYVKSETQQPNLCLAGGVALNCVANGRIHREGLFENIWIQPAAGDAGGALGAALVASHQYLGTARTRRLPDAMQGSLLGPEFASDEIEQLLSAKGVRFRVLDDDKLCEHIASEIARGKIVGWFQGRMEYGPRALGNRSILADPRGVDVQRKVNLKIKFRESFRPFAPSVIEERLGEYFDHNAPSPYMLMVAPVRGAKIDGHGFDRLKTISSPVPAVTHVDESARIQTVSEQSNPLYYKLLSAFDEITGCPVLVNTSFNVRGEPIVCSPLDALTCFSRTHMDLLVLGNHVISRADLGDLREELLDPESVAILYGLD